MSYPAHGANPMYIYETFNCQMPEQIIDFSVNVNPFEAPYMVSHFQKHLGQWLTEYPDPHLTSLKQVISSKEGISEEHLFIGNGAAQCIFLLAQYFQGKTVGIIQPTFVEYKAASQLYGCVIKELVLKKEDEWFIKPEDIRHFIQEVDVLFICNPNNPTGIALDHPTMIEIILLAKEANTFLIIDEAFYDFSSIPCSVAGEVEVNEHVIVLRSLTKMYKLAGIRLGYVIAPARICKELSAFSPPWSVNRFAQELALDVLSRRSYAREVQEKIKLERERVCLEIQKLGYYVSKSSVNYYLLSDLSIETNMNSFIQFLLSNGIVPRHTYNFLGLDGRYVRLAVQDCESNSLLIEHLKGWKERC